MIKITPVTGDKLNSFIVKKELPEHTSVLAATENGKDSGYVATIICEGALAIIDLEFADAMNADLLIRAALSYGFNRGLKLCFASMELDCTPMRAVGFSQCQDCLMIEIEKVVHIKQ